MSRSGSGRSLAAKAWPKVRLLLVLVIAMSMAGFVALDVGLVFAADLLFYLEILFGAWTVALFARFMPGLPTALMLLPYRLFDPGVSGDRGKAEDEAAAAE